MPTFAIPSVRGVLPSKSVCACVCFVFNHLSLCSSFTSFLRREAGGEVGGLMGSGEGAESASRESRVSSRAWPQSALPALAGLLARAAAGLRGVGRRQGRGDQGEPKPSLRAASGRGRNPVPVPDQGAAAPQDLILSRALQDPQLVPSCLCRALALHLGP